MVRKQTQTTRRQHTQSQHTDFNTHWIIKAHRQTTNWQLPFSQKDHLLICATNEVNWGDFPRQYLWRQGVGGTETEVFIVDTLTSVQLSNAEAGKPQAEHYWTPCPVAAPVTQAGTAAKPLQYVDHGKCEGSVSQHCWPLCLPVWQAQHSVENSSHWGWACTFNRLSVTQKCLGDHVWWGVGYFFISLP